MKITYDEREDVLRILFSDEPIETVQRDSSGITLDYDQHGFLVGLELHNAARHLSRPNRVEFMSVPSGGQPARLDRASVPLDFVFPAIANLAARD